MSARHAGFPVVSVRKPKKATKTNPIMIPINYTETVAVPAKNPTETGCVSYLDQESEIRCREEVEFGVGLAPSQYRNSLIVYRDSTRKRFISKVNLEAKLKPMKYSETHFMRPKTEVNTYVTFLDHQVDNGPSWYRSAVTLKPKSFSTTKLHNFQYHHNFNNNEGEILENGIVNGGVNHNNLMDTSSSPETSPSVRSGPFVYNVPPRSPDLMNGHVSPHSSESDDFHSIPDE